MSATEHTAPDAEVLIEMVSGAEGPSVYINDTRVAGPKPWGGGKSLRSWKTMASRIRNSLPEPVDPVGVATGKQDILERLDEAALQVGAIRIALRVGDTDGADERLDRVGIMLQQLSSLVTHGKGGTKQP